MHHYFMCATTTGFYFNNKTATVPHRVRLPARTSQPATVITSPMMTEIEDGNGEMAFLLSCVHMCVKAHVHEQKRNK